MSLVDTETIVMDAFDRFLLGTIELQAWKDDGQRPPPNLDDLAELLVKRVWSTLLPFRGLQAFRWTDTCGQSMVWPADAHALEAPDLEIAPGAFEGRYVWSFWGVNASHQEVVQFVSTHLPWQRRLISAVDAMVALLAHMEHGDLNSRARALKKTIRRAFRRRSVLTDGLKRAMDALALFPKAHVANQSAQFRHELAIYVAHWTINLLMGTGWRWRPVQNEAFDAQLRRLRAELQDHDGASNRYAALLAAKPVIALLDDDNGDNDALALLVNWAALHADLRSHLGQGDTSRSIEFCAFRKTDASQSHCFDNTNIRRLVRQTRTYLAKLVEHSATEILRDSDEQKQPRARTSKSTEQAGTETSAGETSNAEGTCNQAGEPAVEGSRARVDDPKETFDGFTPTLLAWLCLQTLAPVNEPGGRSQSSWEVALGSASSRQDTRVRAFASFAFVMRELLRALIFSDTAGKTGYQISVDTFREAMVDVVAWHAHHTLQISPRLDLRRVLGHINQVSRERVGCFGLFRHVVEIYAGGQFLLGVQLRENGKSLAATLAEESVQSDSPADQQRIRKAAALAAIFHDAGLSLQIGLTRPSLDQPSFIGSAALDEAHQSAASAATDMRNQALQALEASDFVRGFAEESQLLRWLKRDRHGGRDHELLGAWYFLQTIQDDLPQMDRWTRQAAGRAILLHAARTVSVSSRNEPVAFALGVLDEIFHWEPSMHQAPTERSGRPAALVGTATSARNRGHVLWPDLRVEAIGEDVKAWMAGETFRLRIQLDPALADTGSSVFHWLATSQNLQRFGAPKDLHLQVSLEMRHIGWRADTGFGNLEMLWAVLAKLKNAGALRIWLDDADKSRNGLHASSDAVKDALRITLGKVPRSPIWHDDVHRVLPDLRFALRGVSQRARMLAPAPPQPQPQAE